MIRKNRLCENWACMCMLVTIIVEYLLLKSTAKITIGDGPDLFHKNLNFMSLNISHSEPQIIASFLHEFVRFQGVRKLLIVGETNVAKSDKSLSLHHKTLKYLITYFFKRNFYTGICNAKHFKIPDRTDQSDQYQSNATSYKSNILHEILELTQKMKPTHFRVNFALSTSAQKLGIVILNPNFPNTLNLLRWSAESENNFFKTSNIWFIWGANFEEHIKALERKNIFIPSDSEVYIVSPNLHHIVSADANSGRMTINTITFDIHSIYKIVPECSLKITTIASQLEGPNKVQKVLREFGSPINRRWNLEGTVFNTGIVIAFPDLYTNIDDTTLRHIDTITKVNYRLTKELANKLNIRFNTFQTDNWGWRKANGSFDGLMGHFQRLSLDFGQMAVFMRTDRLLAVDFAAETYRIRAGMIFRQPSLSAVENIFTLPFDKYVWLSIFTLYFIIILILALQLLMSPISSDFDLWDCVFVVWCAMCQQGFSGNMNSRSGRIIILSTFIAALFLFTSFSANIVALLQSPSESINTLNDLRQSPLDIGVQDTVYNKIFFNEASDPVTNDLYLKKIAPKGDDAYMRPNTGIHRMRKGLFAYQIELQAGYQIISDTFSEPEKCGLKEIEPFQLPMIGIPMRKNFPYKELFRRQLRWQREVGLMKREELKWIPQKPKCEGNVGGFVSIGLTECRYAFKMFATGIVIALIVFFGEIGLKHTLKKFPENLMIYVQVNE